MANKYFDKMNHISRDSHVKLCPASHENPEHSITLCKVRNYSNTFSLSLRLGSGIHHLEKPTLIRTKLDNFEALWCFTSTRPSSSLFPPCQWRSVSVVTYRSRRRKRQINTAEIILPGYWWRGGGENFSMVLASSFRNCELADRKN